MKKILLFILFFGISQFACANEVNFYKNITTFTNHFNGGFTGINLFVDGDFNIVSGFGGLDQYTQTIKANSENAKGNLHLRVFFIKEINGISCTVEAPFMLPLKVENKDIVLPTNIYSITDKISFSDERCRVLNVHSFEVTINQYGSEYRIKAVRG